MGRACGHDEQSGTTCDAVTQAGVRLFILRFLLFSKGCVIISQLLPNLVRILCLGRREQSKLNAALREGQAELSYSSSAQLFHSWAAFTYIGSVFVAHAGVEHRLHLVLQSISREVMRVTAEKSETHTWNQSLLV